MRTPRIHIAKDGTRSYRIQVRVKGHPTVSVTRATAREARLAALEEEANIRAGRFKDREDRRRTLADLIDAYTKARRAQVPAGTWKSREPQLRCWRKVLGSYFLGAITPAMVEEALGGLDLAGSTRNRYLSALSIVFDHGARSLRWCTENPCRLVARLPEEPNPHQHLEDDGQTRAALAACAASPEPLLYPAVLGYLLTGRRLNEQRGLCWDEPSYRAAMGGPYAPSGWVDWERGVATVPHPKNRKPLVYPVPDVVLALWRRIPRVVGNPFLFASASTRGPAWLDRALSRAMATAGLKVTAHGLRHTCATVVGEEGGTGFDVMAVLGQRSLAAANAYVHARLAHVRNVQDRVGERVLGGN